MYLTYEEYQEYGGALQEPEFNRFSLESKAKLDYMTENRLVNDKIYHPNVKFAMLKLIELYKRKSEYEKTDGGVISSESNDGVSVSYATQSSRDFLETFDKDAYNVVKEHLMHETNEAGVPLMYRGW